MLPPDLLGLIGFVILEMKVKFPVFNISLFKSNRRFALSNLAALINYATTFAITFLLSLYLQYILGLCPRDAGMILITQPLMMAIVASISGKLSDTYDPRILASAGMAIIVVGLIMLSFLTEHSTTHLPGGDPGHRWLWLRHVLLAQYQCHHGLGG